MRYLTFFCALVAIGCGGGGGGNSDPSPLEGNYLGTWGAGSPSSVPPPGDSGTFNIAVSASGVVTGTVGNTGLGETGQVTGTLGADGEINLAIDYPSHDVAVDGNITPELDGNCTFVTDKYNRTLHVFNTHVVLNKQ